MAITTHGVRSAVGLAQLRIFEEEGVDPARVVIGHADSYPVLDHYLAILERGANLQFDFLGHRFQTEEAEEPRLVELIVELLERGWGGQLLLSQDVCHNSQLKARRAASATPTCSSTSCRPCAPPRSGRGRSSRSRSRTRAAS